jgi:hypothetical protein
MGPGTPLAVTKVTRTCVGDPGITYKYLGLRMFSHPWTDSAAPTDTSASAVSAAYTCLRRQNEALDARSQRCLTKEGKGGSTRFSLTLINRMDPTARKTDLKEEPEFGMGKVSVSWHADSSLVHESTIAVYCVHRGDDGAWPLVIESPEDSKKRKRREEKDAKRAAKAAKKVRFAWLGWLAACLLASARSSRDASENRADRATPHCCARSGEEAQGRGWYSAASCCWRRRAEEREGVARGAAGRPRHRRSQQQGEQRHHAVEGPEARLPRRRRGRRENVDD